MKQEAKKVYTRKVVVTVEIDYSVSEREGDEYENKDLCDESFAICETIRPNFHTVSEGVRLNAVKVTSPNREYYADYEDEDLN